MEGSACLHQCVSSVNILRTARDTTLTYKPLDLPGYTLLRKDRTRSGGGGLFTLIHNDIPFTNRTQNTLGTLPPSNITELQSVRVRVSKQNINIHNIYIPPTSSTPQDYNPQLEPLNNLQNSLILGDPNAHSTEWLLTKHRYSGHNIH